MCNVVSRAAAFALLAIALATPRAFTQSSRAPAPKKAGDLSVILDTWVRNSAQIKTLSAKFLRHDHRPVFGHQEYIYEARWKDSGKAVINIEEVMNHGKQTELERIVWTARDVWQYEAHKKEVLHWSLEQAADYEEFRSMLTHYWAGRMAGNQFDLIFTSLKSPKAVDPLPFLIDMQEIVAKKQFGFELAAGAKPGQIVVRARPLQHDQKSLYSDVMITLDKERCLPVAIEYQRGLRAKDTRHYTLLEVQLNKPIDDAAFEPKVPTGWKVQSPLK
jgi:outer membrane lipoprotein-sorting protein